MSGEIEGTIKNCGSCKTPIIYVKIIKEWNGKKEEKLQWQNVEDQKPHFSYVSEKNYKCHPPGPVEPKPEPKPEPPKESKKALVTSPFDEAEIIVRWASERAYKMTMEDIPDYSKLTTQEKSGLGQKHGMLTRLMVDTTLDLLKQHGIKTKYPGED